MSDDENVKWADIPRESRGLRACMVCKLMKTSKQFFESGCENCPMIDYRGNSNNVEQCTTANFSGSIALMSPKDSFIARFNGLTGRVPGLYAARVVGDLPESIEDLLNAQK